MLSLELRVGDKEKTMVKCALQDNGTIINIKFFICYQKRALGIIVHLIRTEGGSVLIRSVRRGRGSLVIENAST